jgi:predicted Fe-Mo cluster-binding NifX family protein
MRRLAMGVIDGSHGLSSVLDGRFGRTPCFVVVETSSGEVVEAVDNDGRHAAHGAGLSAATLVRAHDVDGVVAERFGPKAVQALEAMGIVMLRGAAGATVGQVLQAWEGGRLGCGPTSEEP